MAADEGKEVLLVSDHQMIGKLLNLLLKSQGMLTNMGNSLSKGIEYKKTKRHVTSLLIFDLNVTSKEGSRAMDAIRNFDTVGEVPPRIIFSNFDVDYEDCGVRISDNCYLLKKPFSTQ